MQARTRDRLSLLEAKIAPKGPQFVFVGFDAEAGLPRQILDPAGEPGTPSRDERLAAFKVPVKVVFSPDPLPRNPTGKLMKGELKRLFAKEKVHDEPGPYRDE